MGKDDQKPVPRVRLLKVIVQPVVVIDDGDQLQEVTVDPITVPAPEWPSYPTNRFKEQLQGLQQQLVTPPAEPAQEA